MTSGETHEISAVLARVDEERLWWESVLDKGNQEVMLKPGLSGDWSFRDVIVHLNFWDTRRIEKLRAERDGNEFVDPIPSEILAMSDEDEQTDRINEWNQESEKHTPLSDVLSLSRANLYRVYEFVGTTAVEHLNDPNFFPSLEGNSLAEYITSGSYFEHVHDEHGPVIQQWMSSQSST